MKFSNLSYVLSLVLIAAGMMQQAAPMGGDGGERRNIRTLLESADKSLQRGAYDSALALYSDASQLLKGDLTLETVKAEIGIANASFRLGRYQPVISRLRTIEENAAHYEGYSGSEWQMSVSMLLGYALMVGEFPDSARPFADRSLRLAESLFGPSHPKTGAAYYTLGLIDKQLANYAEARTSLGMAVQVQQLNAPQGDAGTANSMTMLGAVCDDLNDYDAALVWLHRADSLYRRLGIASTIQAGSSRLHLLSTLNNRGEYTAALAVGKQAVALYWDRQLFSHSNLASALAKMGEVSENIGDLESAKEYLTKALSLFETHHPGKHSAIGMTLVRIADVDLRLGDTAAAYRQAVKGLTVYRQARGAHHPQTAYMVEVKGRICLATGRLHEAKESFLEALRIRSAAEAARSRSDLVALNTSVAGTYLRLGMPDSAREYLRSADRVSIASAFLPVPVRVELFRCHAAYHRMTGDPVSALRMLHEGIRAIPVSTASMDAGTPVNGPGTLHKELLLSLIVEQADLLQEDYRRTRSVNTLSDAYGLMRDALDLLDGIRRELFREGSKIALAERSGRIYRRTCGMAMDLFRETGDPEYRTQAFVIADRNKANAVVDRLYEMHARRDAGIPDSLMAEERMLLDTLARLEQRLAVAGSDGRSSASPDGSRDQVQYVQLRHRHREMVEGFERSFPGYLLRKSERPALTLEALQRSLPDSTALIEYLLDDERSFAFIVRKNSLSVVELKGRTALGDHVNRTLTGLRSYDGKNFMRHAEESYRALFRPIEASLKDIRRLRIVPDNVLHYLPFEALPLQRASGPSNTQGFLIERYEVAYSYSAAYYLGMQEGGRTVQGRTIAGFAPVFRDSSGNSGFLAHREEVHRSGLTKAATITRDRRSFNELTYSPKELGEIERSMLPTGAKVHRFEHSSASEENFKQLGPRYDILHIATHGFINEQEPRFSAIVFSQPGSDSSAEDGVLYAHETAALELNADLVVLSSCESGLGRMADGEGMLALSRGLIYAGARNVILSLWKVPDKQTYQLMSSFYRSLADCGSYAAALRRAKLTMLASPATRFPAKWAGFTLVGH